jgi:hypothetical protein
MPVPAGVEVLFVFLNSFGWWFPFPHWFPLFQLEKKKSTRSAT